MLSARQVQVLAQHFQQRLVHGGIDIEGLAVDAQANQLLHLPLYTAWRRSLNAAKPSRRSSLNNTRRYASASKRTPSSSDWLKLMARLDWRTPIGPLSAILRAMASTVGTTSRAATTWLTMPHSS